MLMLENLNEAFNQQKKVVSTPYMKLKDKKIDLASGNATTDYKGTLIPVNKPNLHFNHNTNTLTLKISKPSKKEPKFKVRQTIYIHNNKAGSTNSLGAINK